MVRIREFSILGIGIIAPIIAIIIWAKTKTMIPNTAPLSQILLILHLKLYEYVYANANIIPIIKCIAQPIETGIPSIPESISGGDILGIPIIGASIITTVIMAVPTIPARIDF